MRERDREKRREMYINYFTTYSITNPKFMIFFHFLFILLSFTRNDHLSNFLLANLLIIFSILTLY